MNELKRYLLTEQIVQHPAGYWCKVADAQALISERDQRIQALEAQLLMSQSRLVSNELATDNRAWAIDKVFEMGLDETEK